MSVFFLSIYNLLLSILIIIISIPALFVSKRFRTEVSYHLLERFAVGPALNKKLHGGKKVIWFHCASLGEVRAIEPILDKLKNDFLIALTTTAKSGREYASKISGLALVSLFPLDIYPIAIKAFKRIDPDIFILIETELWASVLYAAHRRGIKTAVLNARISDKTYRIYRKARFFWKYFISAIDIVLARSKEDGRRFACFMPKDAQIVVTGNIKYDRDFSIKPAREAMFFSADDLIFTAGSTREGEEELIAAAYKKVSKAYPAVKFICAPRHINRLPEITALLASQNIPYSLFSKPPYKSNFILVDIFGKLQNIYSISDICFVGGSLVDKGGQNPIEPAAYAKPVIFGKHMDNFKNEKRTLLIYGGALEVSPQNLANSIIALFSNPAKLKDMAQKALYAVKSQGGAVSISIDKIKEMLDES